VPYVIEVIYVFSNVLDIIHSNGAEISNRVI